MKSRTSTTAAVPSTHLFFSVEILGHGYEIIGENFEEKFEIGNRIERGGNRNVGETLDSEVSSHHSRLYWLPS